MDSQRQQKFARQIQKDLSDIFQKEISIAPAGVLATVSAVRVSPDLSIASVYISYLGQIDKAAALAFLEDKNKTIRNVLAQRIRKQARIIPELRFFIDNTGEEADRMEKLLAGLNIPKDPDAGKAS